MSVVHFQCPTCQAPLRLQDRALFLGRSFACPDCTALLLIEAHGHDGVAARVITAPVEELRRTLQSPSPAKSKSGERPHAPAPLATKLPNFGIPLQPRASLMDTLGRRPALLGWSVAILFAIVLFAVINASNTPPTPVAELVAEKDKPPIEKPKDDAQADKDQPPPQNDSELAANDPNAKPPEPPPNKNADEPDVVAPDQEKVVPVAKLNPVLKQADNAAPQPAVDPTLPDNKPPPAEARKKTTAETIAARLQQKIVRFEQPKPIPFVKLLDILEDLAGVPIVWDLETVDDKQLQKPVTLKLQETTVGEILDAILKQVSLERRIVDGRIELLLPE